MPVSADVETFQDWAGDSITETPYLGVTTAAGGTTFQGQVIRSYLGNGATVVLSNPTASPSTYFAADFWVGGFTFPTTRIDLYDEGMVYLGSAGSVGVGVGGTGDNPAVRHAEVKMNGSAPSLYLDGVYSSSGAAIAKNPTYYKLINVNSPVGGSTTVYLDNIVIGGTDHHAIGSIASNWSVIRDLNNPAATGSYAWNPATSAWVLQDSNYFYVDANKEGVASETLLIRRLSDGVVVNTTTVSAAHTRVAYNIPRLFSEAEITDGQYSIGFSGSTNLGYFWILSNGAVISFDRSTYNMAETATLTYLITPSYYDAATYDYTFRIVNIYGETKSSGTIINAGTTTVTFASPTYTAGVYYAEIVATKKSDLSESILAYSAMTLHDYIVLSGVAMNAQNATVLSGVNINVTQAITMQDVTSGFDGNYTTNATFFSGGVITINATMSGYKQYVYSFTPLVSGTKFINISMEPLNPTYTGWSSIGGVIRDSQYGNPIAGANASGVNGTTYTNVSNVAGWYQFDNIANETLYDVWSSRNGYGNSTVYHVLAIDGFVSQPLTMTPQYTLTVLFVDSSTLLPIPIVDVTDSLGYVETTSVGTYNHSYDYGAVVLYLISSGYDTRSASFIMDSNRTETVTLAKSVVNSGANLNLLYPHEVRIIVADKFGLAQDNVYVTAIMMNSTIENTNWWATLFGISQQATPINGTEMYGYTDSFGSIVFPMVGSGRYDLTFTDESAGINTVKTIHPQENTYTFIVDTTRSATPESNSGNITVNLTTFASGSNVYLNVSYVNNRLTTTNVYYYIVFSNRTVFYAKNFTGTPPTLNQSVDFGYPVANSRGTSYVWGIESYDTKWGWTNKSLGITMKGVDGVLFNPFTYKDRW
jgi:hypothetical protein